MVPGLVFILSGLTCLICTVLLFRGYFSSSVRLLFWSGLCFLGLTIDHIMLYIDVIIIGDDASIVLWRRLPGLAGLILLVIGLVWESK